MGHKIICFFQQKHKFSMFYVFFFKSEGVVRKYNTISERRKNVLTVWQNPDEYEADHVGLKPNATQDEIVLAHYDAIMTPEIKDYRSNCVA